MRRRSFLQSLGAALATPALASILGPLETARRPIDFAAWTEPNGHSRFAIERPFIQSHHRYATDRCRIIRELCVDADTEDATGLKFPNARGLRWEDLEQLDYQEAPAQRWTKAPGLHSPCPECHPLGLIGPTTPCPCVEQVKKDLANFTHEYGSDPLSDDSDPPQDEWPEEWYCSKCRNGLRGQICPRCNGEAWVEEVQIVAGCPFRMDFYAELQKLPDPRISVMHEWYQHGQPFGILGFRCDGAEGLIMGMNAGPAAHAKKR